MSMSHGTRFIRNSHVPWHARHAFRKESSPISYIYKREFGWSVGMSRTSHCTNTGHLAVRTREKVFAAIKVVAVGKEVAVIKVVSVGKGDAVLNVAAMGMGVAEIKVVA